MTASISCAPRQHAALQLEVVEAVALVRCLGQSHDRLCRQRYLVAQAKPGVGAIRLAAVVEFGLRAIAHVEEVAQDVDGFALHAFAEKRCDGYVHELAHQVEQRGFHRGNRVDRGPQVERLRAAAAGVAVGERAAHRVQDVVVLAQPLADDQAAARLRWSGGSSRHRAPHPIRFRPRCPSESRCCA